MTKCKLKNLTQLLWALAVSVLPTFPALACPFCHTDTGKAVNQQIFNGGFTLNLFIAALPFLLIYVAIALLHFGWPKRRTKTIINKT